MNTISIIGCVVGVIACVVGVATFVSAQMTKSRQDGVQLAKLDQCVNGIEEIKLSMKEKNHEVDNLLDEHSRAIVELQTQVKNIYKQLQIQH